MKKQFTKQSILSNCGCYSREEAMIHLTKSKFTISEILDFDLPIKDKAWFIIMKCELTDDELKKIAIGCSLIVLPIYESKYPNNKAPREAIQAVKDYLKGKIKIKKLEQKRIKDIYTIYNFVTDTDCDSFYAAKSALYIIDIITNNLIIDAVLVVVSNSVWAAHGDAIIINKLLLFFKNFVIKN